MLRESLVLIDFLHMLMPLTCTQMDVAVGAHALFVCGGVSDIWHGDTVLPSESQGRNLSVDPLESV